MIDHVNLKELFEIKNLPEGIPTEVTKLEVSIDAISMSFEGSIACAYDETKNPTVPSISLENVWLRAQRRWENKATQTPASWKISFQFLVYLNVVDDDEQNKTSIDDAAGATSSSPANQPCELRGGVDYSSGTGAGDASWTLTAALDGLTVSHLAQFWPKGEVRDSAMAMLSHILIEHMDMTYHFGKGDGDGGSEFQIGGKLLLGDIFLGLDFHCNDDGWEFGGKLGISTPGTEEILSNGSVTVAKILAAIVGKDSLPDIPGAVGDITIGKPNNEGEALSFKCTLIKETSAQGSDDKPDDILFSTFSIQVAAVSLTMVQWRVTSWPKTVPSKRVIKVALGGFGPVKAPLVGEIKQPFEQLIYMWVSDKATASIPQPPTPIPMAVISADRGQPKAGITKKEFDVIDLHLASPEDKLYFKSNALDPAKISPTDFVIEAGSHFVATVKNDKGLIVAVLDYVFGRPKAASGKNHLIPLDEETPNKEAAKAPLKRSMGPLLIENVGLTYDMKEKRLGIMFDATFLMGPIGLALVGFGLSVAVGNSAKLEQQALDCGETGSDVIRCSSLPVSDPRFSLDGLLVSFEKPPITIAGGFARTKMEGSIFYAGGLIVGFTPWKLQAMGVYGEVKKAQNQQTKMGHNRHLSGCSSYSIIELPDDDIDNREELDALQFDNIDTQDDSDTFTMVFVILKLEGPLFTIGCADISGLTAGVGVNSAIRLPSAESVLEFPFTRPSGTPSPDQGPLAALKAVLWPGPNTVPWFTPREGSFWIAAGLKATALTMISVDAVVVISLNPSIQLGLFGVAVIDLPSLDSPVKVAHAELGIACLFDPVAGIFRFDAQLSPRSYVLHESCHLTGGLALYSWAQTGDFVFTLGGYHQAYVRPTSFPNPPRLGIAWSFSDHIRISGEAYFAVTARSCMGGGKLNATLTAGPLTAWFDAFLDFLINFRPFKFAADGGLSVGVRYSLDLWLVTIRIKVEIGATLSVLGPPMAGTVHVNFWVFGFDINFGDRDAALRNALESEMTLTGFKELVLKAGGDSGKALPLPSDWVDVEPESQITDDTAKPKNKRKLPVQLHVWPGSRRRSFS